MRFAALALSAIGICGPAHAGGSAAGTVNRLYRDFAWEAVVASPNAAGLAQQPKGVLLRYFTPRLAAALAADDACTKRRGEICSLDFMPIWGSQDPAAEELQVTPGAAPEQVTVRYTYPSTGQVISLDYRLVQTKVGWRVSDILYQSGDSLAHLLSAESR